MAERQSDYCNPLAHAAEGYLGYCYGRAHKNGTFSHSFHLYRGI